MVHYSTDFVFDGEKGAPYTEDDKPAPINVYGKTKLDAELAVASITDNHLILRIAWVYGRKSRNFVWTMIEKAIRTNLVLINPDAAVNAAGPSTERHRV